MCNLLKWNYYIEYCLQLSQTMNGESSNRILPIKSLLQNLKQESKKQYLQLDNKSTTGNVHQNNQTNVPQTHRQKHLIDNFTNIAARDQKKGISLNKNNDKTNYYQYPSKESPQLIDPGFNLYGPKKDKNNCERTNRFPNHNQQPFRIDFQSDHYGYSNKNIKSEQIIYHQVKQEIKALNKNIDTTHKFAEDFDRESSILTEKLNSKFQQETRSYSKFQKMESQPIFKDELTKIKTELFHKQALLFTKTQELQQKEKIIRSLQDKVQMKQKKGEKIPMEVTEKLMIMESTIKKQEKQIQFLRMELDQSKQLYNKYEEDTATNYTLINLKLRQYEAEERQKSYQISEIKEKEKKKYEQQQKSIKTLKELLKEKQDINNQIRQQLASNQQNLLKSQSLLKEKEVDFSKQLEIKQIFIRQLSAQIGDLKKSLKHMEERIRQMIQEESEMRQISLKFNEAKLLYKEKQRLNEASILEFKSRIGQLNEIIFKRESSLIAYKEKNIELEQKLKKAVQQSPTRNNSPPRASTSKLVKDNERLNAIAKDLDKRLYQSYKLNQSLNEEVVKRDLIILNASYLSKYGKDIE